VQQGQRLVNAPLIQASERLIKEQNPRIRCNGSRDSNAFGLAVR
jgi:hypothetical protein